MHHSLSGGHPAGELAAGTVTACLAGVELGPAVIRVAVFSPGFELLGKMKISTKPERGLAATEERIERCIRYALDECDLPPSTLQRVGVAIPGAVFEPGGRLCLGPPFGWRSVEFAAGLAGRLGVPVWAGNGFSLAAVAVHRFERPGDGSSLAVLVPGADTGLGLVRNGAPVDLGTWPPGRALLPPEAGQVVARTSDPRFQLFRPRDFRKAIRKGEAPALEALTASVRAGANGLARLVREEGIRRIALAGGAIDENKAAMVTAAKDILDAAAGEPVEVFVSELGDLSPLLGAVWLAEPTPARV